MIVFDLQQKEVICQDAINRYPDECCGILLGVRNHQGHRIVREVYIAVNTLRKELRRKHFMIGTEALLEAEAIADMRGYEVLGFYHSHTDCVAAASKEDSDFAVPDLSYLIVAVEKGRITQLLSWEKAKVSRRAKDYQESAVFMRKEKIEIKNDRGERWQ